MNQPDTPVSRYGRERICPQCGTRVAQRALNCFFCGASLERAPRQRISIPWSDLALFVVIGGLLAFWWTRAPDDGVNSEPSQIVGGAQTSVPVPSPAPSPGLLAPSSTPSPSPTTTPTPTAAPTPIRYKIVSGDSLELIAGRFETSLKDLMEANGLSATDLLHIGDELLIPVGGSTPLPTPAPTPTGGTLVYTVQPGDTVQSIAIRFNSQVDWILQANQMQADDLLQINRSLLVPMTAATPAPSVTPTRSPRPVQTVGLPFRKPALLAPADGAMVSGGDDVVLSWASVALLEDDQWYQVTLGIRDAQAPVAPYWTKGTTWRLPDDLRRADGEATRFTWHVQVVSGSPSDPGDHLSQPSDERSFVWN